jgi:outer membrane receptor protein involved in Fe transport
LLLARAASADDGDAITGDEEITVESDAPPAAQGAAHLSRENLERLPGAGNDVMRTLQAMPGVASYPLPIGDSGIVIRGSSPEDSKILIDDFEVPSLYHDIGFKSVVPAEAIQSLDYIPGGFDVAYGRAASGIVKLTTRAGGETGQQAEISGNDASVLAQGTEGKLRYLVAGRRSVIDFILPALLPDNLDLALTTVPRFYDEQIRLDYAATDHWTLRASSIGSDDVLELYASRDKNADKRFYDRTRFIRATTSANYYKSDDEGAWAATVALSAIAQQHDMARGEAQHYNVTSPTVTARAEVTRFERSAIGLTDLEIRNGVEAQEARHSLDIAIGEDPREGDPTVDDPMDTSTRYKGVVTSPEVAAWTTVAASLDPRVRATVGMRADAFMRNHDSILQPRGQLEFKLTSTVTARIASGLYTRSPEHQTELLDDSLKAERSKQFITGMQFDPFAGLRVQTSLYYSDRTQLIARQMDGSLANTGRGTTYGAEVMAVLARGPWFGWLSYAYSHSTRIDTPGSQPRLFDYDQPHNATVAASYKHKSWTLGARWRIASGLPSTPVDVAVFDSDANRYDPLFGATNSVRAPMHHQLDIRFDKKWTWGPVKMTKFIDVQNVYMNQSAVGYVYGFDYTQRAAFHNLPILPTAGLRGEW